MGIRYEQRIRMTSSTRKSAGQMLYPGVILHGGQFIIMKAQRPGGSTRVAVQPRAAEVSAYPVDKSVDQKKTLGRGRLKDSV